MEKVKVIIVDDEKSARDILTKLLLKAFSNIEICATAANVPEAVLEIKNNNPDIVFLDVEMPQYAGYEIVNFFDEIDFQIIFATAYDRFAMKAFELNAIDYLVKPIDRIKLNKSVEKAIQRIKEKKSFSDYKSLIETIASSNPSFITVSESGQKQRIKTNEIFAISAEGAYSQIHLEQSKITVSKNIGAMESELTVEKGFFRTHKSWLVNIQAIKSYSLGRQEVTLKNDIVCKLSRFKKSEFELALLEK